MIRGWFFSLALAVMAATGGAVAQAADGYNFMVPPWQRGQAIDDIRRLYRPMLDYLSARIGVPIVLVSAKTYEEAIDYLASGRADFATMSPVPYIKAQTKTPGVHMLVTELSWSADHHARRDSYAGMLVTLKSRSDINTLADLKGKSLAFVSRDSSSGFVFPTAVLARSGIDYSTFFLKYDFLGSHPRVTDAVAAVHREMADDESRGKRRCRGDLGFQHGAGHRQTWGYFQGRQSGGHPQPGDCGPSEPAG